MLVPPNRENIMSILKKASALAVSAALIAMPVVPASAASLSANMVAAPSISVANDASDLFNVGDSNLQYRHGRYYNNRRHHRRHRRGISPGEIVAGVLVLGGIAAIASAASKKKKQEQQYENRDYRYDSNQDRRYNDNQRRDPRGDDRQAFSGNGIDQAVNACSGAAAQAAGNNARVDQIESISRDGQGWRVQGALSGSSNRSFTCGATNGQVDFVQLSKNRLSYNN